MIKSQIAIVEYQTLINNKDCKNGSRDYLEDDHSIIFYTDLKFFFKTTIVLQSYTSAFLQHSVSQMFQQCVYWLGMMEMKIQHIWRRCIWQVILNMYLALWDLEVISLKSKYKIQYMELSNKVLLSFTASHAPSQNK